MMKYYITLLISILISAHLYVGCKNVNSKKGGQEIINPQKDNPELNKLKGKINSGFDEDSLELSNIYNSYLQRYNDSIKIDTTFIFRDSKVKVDFQYYCTHDSSLTLPEKYIEVYGIKEFVTHNFESSLKIELNDKYILDTIIKKSMFEDTIPIELRKYGVLLYPVLTFKKGNRVEIDYSLSIPLTDVGRLISFPIINDEELKRKR
ncbi:hypothetical protein [Chitinophaga flava]|uniref:DUF4738 domain-containing protein n=1 Tax=Chitinophaga flava TaxID=2259036 RepID=A0A365Y3H2_9BACT|nr:hypothetical protein [Chitinophaga flava]RBL93166.1 hypothetical protein DF182_11510 [Chitinophaga flava]